MQQQGFDAGALNHSLLNKMNKVTKEFELPGALQTSSRRPTGATAKEKPAMPRRGRPAKAKIPGPPRPSTTADDIAHRGGNRRLGRPRKEDLARLLPSRVSKRLSKPDMTLSLHQEQESENDVDTVGEVARTGKNSAPLAFLIGRDIRLIGRYTTEEGQMKEVAGSDLPEGLLTEIVTLVKECDDIRPDWQDYQDELHKCMRMQVLTTQKSLRTSVFEGHTVADRRCTELRKPCMFWDDERQGFV